MPADFRIDQATPGTGVMGRARHDLVPGEIITLVAGNTGAGIAHTWEILDKVGSTAVLSAASGDTVTIGPFGQITRPCAFRIRHLEDDNGTVTESVRVCSVVTPVLGLRIPLFGDTAPLTQRLDANDPALSEDNAVYVDRAGLGSTEQNWRGWAEWAYLITLALESFAAEDRVESLAFSHSVLGTTEEVIGSIYLEAGSTIRAASNAVLGGLLVGDTATLRLRRFTGGSQIALWTHTGTLTNVVLGGDVLIANSDWYDITLVAGDVSENALVKGLRLLVGV